MSVEREITNMLCILTRKSESGIYPAKVKSVEGTACTVERIHDDGEFKNVKLSLTEKDEVGLVITSAMDSQVLVANVDEYSRFVCLHSDIEQVTLDAIDKIMTSGGNKVKLTGGDKIELTCQKKTGINAKNKITITGGGKIAIKANNIELNKGENGGLIKIEVLTKKINELVDVFNKHTHDGAIVMAAGSAETKGKSGKPTSQQTPLERDYYENEKVTH